MIWDSEVSGEERGEVVTGSLTGDFGFGVAIATGSMLITCRNNRWISIGALDGGYFCIAVSVRECGSGR